ncbi:MAG: hypothetical protein WKG03_12020 [Telluria sp.]
MSQYVLEADIREEPQQADAGRRHPHGLDEQLVLSELDPESVLDHLEPDDKIELITFGTVRETCPQCPQTHLKLVLRQRRVRVAHLFCASCLCCYDAHYVNGASALSI